MIQLNELRKSLGLSHGAVAALPGVSRSYYSLAEAGRRRVPQEWWNQLKLMNAALERASGAAGSPADDVELEESLKVLNTLITENNERKIRLAELQIRYHKIRETYPQLKNAYNILCLELKIFSGKNEALTDLKNRVETIEKQLRASSPVHQQLLELEIDQLQTEITKYDTLISKINDDIQDRLITKNEVDDHFLARLMKMQGRTENNKTKKVLYMLNNIQVIDTVAECDTVIANSQNRISTLNLRKSILALKQTNSAAYVAGLESELAAVVQSLANLTEEANNLPEGPAKEDKLYEVSRAEFRKRGILKSLRSSNTDNIIERDITMARLDGEIVVYQSIIDQVTAHRTTLAA